MKDLATLITAFAGLLWPILAIVAFWSLRGEIRGLVARLQTAKVLGQEITLREDLDQLEASASAAVSVASALPPPESEPASAGESDQVRRILDEAARSPKAALLILSAEIERELRILMGSMGMLKRRFLSSMDLAITGLREHGSLSSHISASAALFLAVRNRLVHGYDASDDDILRAIDSGIKILEALKSIPHEAHVVRGITDIYLDAMGEHLLPEVKGVLLESTHSGDGSSTLRIFPTTKQHFRIGERVAWEWDATRTFNRAWYRDPETGMIREAWHEAAEFTGRHFEDI